MNLDLNHIYEGWGKSLRFIPITDGEKELAMTRVSICVQCPKAKEMWLKKFIDGMLQNDTLGSGIGCSVCGCPVNEKALVTDEKCPEGHW